MVISVPGGITLTGMISSVILMCKYKQISQYEQIQNQDYRSYSIHATQNGCS